MVKKKRKIPHEVSDKKLVADVKLLAWYYDRTYSEVAEEALRNYLTKEDKVLSKARELREETQSGVGR